MKPDEVAISRLLRVEEVIPAMERALADFSSGKVVQPIHAMVPVAEHWSFLGLMPAYSLGRFRRVHKKYLGGYVAMCEFAINLKRVTPAFISLLVALCLNMSQGVRQYLGVCSRISARCWEPVLRVKHCSNIPP
jgi:hypothetical protein